MESAFAAAESAGGGKGVVVVKARQAVEWRAWGTLKLKQDTDWRMTHG